MRLTATYRKEQHVVEVVAGEDGKLRFRLGDGREFKSPSSAGRALMGGSACNGWRSWSLDDGAPRPATMPPKGAAKPPAMQPAAKPAKVERPRGDAGGKSFVATKQLEHHRTAR